MEPGDVARPLRVALGEDDVLLREGIARILVGAGLDVVAQALFTSMASVEKHVTAIFRKLPLAPADTEHRRVPAVLTYLRAGHDRP